MASSKGGVKWNDASDVIVTDYDKVDLASVSWFKKADRAQYWRIKVLTWVDLASMKADLIGVTR